MRRFDPGHTRAKQKIEAGELAESNSFVLSAVTLIRPVWSLAGEVKYF